jgi:CheY-like chemotaxis protein
LLLDIGLPGVSGYELARRVREQEWGRKALLIAVTGWGQADDKRRAAEAGFDHHLTKPVNPENVQALLAACRPAPPQ